MSYQGEFSFLTSNWEKQELIDWYDLPGQTIEWIGAHFSLAKTSETGVFNRWRVETFLATAEFTTPKWAGVQLGLPANVFADAWKRAGYFLHPMVAELAETKPSSETLSRLTPEIESKLVLDSKLVDLWLRRLFMAVPPDDLGEMREAFVKKVHKILERSFRFSPLSCVAGSGCLPRTFCLVSRDPVCIKHSFWLDNGKPAGLAPDRVGLHVLRQRPEFVEFVRRDQRERAREQLAAPQEQGT